tara:strand:+ start:168 stop:416 length:249 start_codon:yes stop_codon:yes gene_type:complete
MGYNNNIYAICDIATDMQNTDFSQVITGSGQTARRSVDNTLFLIKYIVEPTFITTGLVVPSKIMNHQEALIEMATPEWNENP